MKYYVGWDVGGWNCDRNRNSRDAVCVLRKDEGMERPVFCRGYWQANIRNVLLSSREFKLLAEFINFGGNGDCAGEKVDINDEKIVIGIDAPLGWPAPAVNLLTSGKTLCDGINPDAPSPVPRASNQNTYLFRETDKWISKRFGKDPLSPVRDMIGSQSLKAIHFLHALGAYRTMEAGVWKRQPNTFIIEAYPAMVKIPDIDHYKETLTQDDFETITDDFWDALKCALTAWYFDERKTELCHPLTDISVEEGWIWFPLAGNV